MKTKWVVDLKKWFQARTAPQWRIILLSFAALVILAPVTIRILHRQLDAHIAYATTISDKGDAYEVIAYIPRFVYLGDTSTIFVPEVVKGFDLSTTPRWDCNLLGPGFDIVLLGHCRWAIAPRAEGHPLLVLTVRASSKKVRAERTPGDIFSGTKLKLVKPLDISYATTLEVAKPIDVSLSNISTLIGILSALAAWTLQSKGARKEP